MIITPILNFAAADDDEEENDNDHDDEYDNDDGDDDGHHIFSKCELHLSNRNNVLILCLFLYVAYN